MDNTVKDRIRSMNPIEEVIGQAIPLRKAGKDYRALCPFHEEKTASFFVSPSRQSYHCFGCGASGDVFDFVMRWNKVDFREALGILSGKSGGRSPGPLPKTSTPVKPKTTNSSISLPRLTPLGGSGDNHSRPLEYLESRRVTPLQVAMYDIRYAASGRYRDRIVFPVHVGGEVRGFAARAIEDSELKYLYPKGMKKSSCLWGFDIASGFGDCVLVEGVFDALRTGFDAIAILGSFLSAGQVSLLYGAGFRRVTVMLDSDAFENSIEICRQLESYFDVRLVALRSGDPGGHSHRQLRGLIDTAPRFGSDESLKEIVNGRIHS